MKNYKIREHLMRKTLKQLDLRIVKAISINFKTNISY